MIDYFFVDGPMEIKLVWRRIQWTRKIRYWTYVEFYMFQYSLITPSSRVAELSFSFIRQVEPQVLLWYYHWRISRWTHRHGIASGCCPQDCWEFRKCRVEWFVVAVVKTTLTCSATFFIVSVLYALVKRDLDSLDLASTVSSPVSCARVRESRLLRNNVGFLGLDDRKLTNLFFLSICRRWFH